MAANLQLVITAVDKASGALNQVEKSAGGLTGTLKKVGVIGGVAAAAGMGLAVGAAVKFIQAAAEEEAGIKRLAAAVDANGGSWAKQGKAIEEAIRQRQKLAFSDDELRSSLTLLTAQTGNVDEALKRQTVAMDLARGAGIDLTSASRLLGKVTDESHTALSRLGIVIDKDADAMQVMAAVQQRFGGQSAAFADSTAGKWARFNNQLDNVKESIGFALLPLVTALADKLSSWLEEHQEDIDKTVQAWGAFARSEIFPILERAFAQLTQLIQGIKETGIIPWLADHKIALIAVAAALGVLVIAFGGPILIIPTLIAAGTLLLANWDSIRAKIDEIVTDFQTKFPVLVQIIEFVFGFIKARVDFWIAEVRAVIRIVTALIHGDFREAWQGIKDMVNGFLNLIKADVENVLRLIVGVVKSVLPDDLIAKPFNKARDSVKWLIDKINDLIDTIKRIPTPGDIFGGVTGAIGGIVPFQHGGIVTKPTLALLAERGQPEAVIPLSQMSNVTQASGPSAQDIGAAVREALQGLSFYLDPDGMVRLVGDRMGRQANLYSRGG